jgi:MobA/MobL family
VALNNFSASVVTRTKAQSVIARAAYNARECLTDDRTGEKKDYRAKGGIEFEGIFAPKGAPSWVQDRQTLWNAVEEREDHSTRPDQAQLARDFKIALPHELNAEQRKWLITDFAREMSRKGMIVDVAIHAPDIHGDERNYHAHLLVTMREITPTGFGNKVREWNKTEVLEKWRERWSELGARALDRAGYKQEADRFREGHKTLKEQYKEAVKRGDHEHAEYLKDRQPTPHLGPDVSAMKRRGVMTQKARSHEMIEERNEARAKGKSMGKDDSGKVEKILKKVPLKSFGKALDSVANAIDSLVSPVMTPERKADAELAAMEREAAARRHREQERDRGDRDR